MINIEVVEKKKTNNRKEQCVRYTVDDKAIEACSYAVFTYQRQVERERFRRHVKSILVLLDYHITKEEPHAQLSFIRELTKNTQIYVPLIDYFWVEQVLELKTHADEDNIHLEDVEKELKRLTASLKDVKEKLEEILIISSLKSFTR